MKSSRYNLFIPSSKNRSFTLYNTIRGSVFCVDPAARRAIEDGGDQIMDRTLRENLVKAGILVNDDLDESAVFRVFRDRMKYSGNSLSIVILTTYTCNLSCTYCFVPSLWSSWGKRVPKESMSMKTSRSIVRFIRNMALLNDYDEIFIDLVGLGEPLLKPEIIFSLIDGLHPLLVENHIRLKINIVSNGTLISSGLLERLRSSNVYFQITLDGPKSIHDKKRVYKNQGGTYDGIMRAFELLRSFEIPFVIRVNVDKGNHEHIEALLDDVVEKVGTGLPIRFLPLLPGIGESCAWSKSCMSNQDSRQIPKLWDVATQKGFTVLLAPLMNYLPCRAMSYSCYVIDLFGDLYKCEGLAGNERFKIGSIDDEGSLPRLADPYYEWMSIDPIDTDDCRNCALLPACGGACPQLLYFYTGSCRQAACTKSKDLVIRNIEYQLRRFYSAGSED